ncbi:hypothetical protein RIF29_21405 [Crotalaria pallida]|uniref:Uncharacterized protein n=1 Tax=Crotalaria pallida TaxID=3830 RepID=A0AAN9F4N5_CROPI
MSKIVYPKVKVRLEPYQQEGGDHGDARDLGLKSFPSLSSPDGEKKDAIVRSIVKAPKCYVPHVLTPRVLVTEDFGDCSMSSDSSGSTGTDENKLNIRASSIPRPRAVISSPDNDVMIGNTNKIRGGRLSATKNGAVLQNRHTQCKSHVVAETPPDTRKSKEPESNNDKVDLVRKKKVHKGSNIKSEKVPRNWKF